MAARRLTWIDISDPAHPIDILAKNYIFTDANNKGYLNSKTETEYGFQLGKLDITELATCTTGLNKFSPQSMCATGQLALPNNHAKRVFIELQREAVKFLTKAGKWKPNTDEKVSIVRYYKRDKESTEVFGSTEEDANKDADGFDKYIAKRHGDFTEEGWTQPDGLQLNPFLFPVPVSDEILEKFSVSITLRLQEPRPDAPGSVPIMREWTGEPLEMDDEGVPLPPSAQPPTVFKPMTITEFENDARFWPEDGKRTKPLRMMVRFTKGNIKFTADRKVWSMPNPIVFATVADSRICKLDLSDADGFCTPTVTHSQMAAAAATAIADAPLAAPKPAVAVVEEQTKAGPPAKAGTKRGRAKKTPPVPGADALAEAHASLMAMEDEA